jgi:hypothetical protein
MGQITDGNQTWRMMLFVLMKRLEDNKRAEFKKGMEELITETHQCSTKTSTLYLNSDVCVNRNNFKHRKNKSGLVNVMYELGMMEFALPK